MLLLAWVQVLQDASSDTPAENPLLEGGRTPEERQASFLELALCLAAGLPDAALDPLLVVSHCFSTVITGVTTFVTVGQQQDT